MRRANNGSWGRRDFLQAATTALAAGVAASSGISTLAAAAERVRAKISDIQTMIVQGPRTYTYVRVVTSDGQYGIAEAYGSPGVGVAEQILALKPALIGADPLHIDRIYTQLGADSDGGRGQRTDGSAHMLMRAASGIEMALWDLAGKLLNVPTSILLGGRFRDRVRVYNHTLPDNMLDKGSCREWAARVRKDPSGFTAHKINIPRTDSIWSPTPPPRPAGSRPRPPRMVDTGRDLSNRHLSTQELIRIVQCYENVREAIGWDHDIMVHCHWELDFGSAVRLADALAPIKPLFLEDALMVDYNDSWKQLTARSPVTIMTGENLARREGFAPFIVNQGCHVVNPDLRNSGGFLETKRIADLASAYGVAVTTHNTASQLHTYQICQWATSIQDFLICETVTGKGDWMDQVLRLDGPYIEKGFIAATDKPGTGVELNEDVVKAHLAPGQTWWGTI